MLFRLPEINFIDDKAGKPVGINEFIGRRPIAAFGNSDGDLEMLQWTTMSGGVRFGLIVHHTDAEREYAYDRDTDVWKSRQGPGRRGHQQMDGGGYEEGLESYFPARAIRLCVSRTIRFCATVRAGDKLIDGQFELRAAAKI